MTFCQSPHPLNPDAMKVLTLHQPWATLIALGVKTIETRPQKTNVRGRIAIHAAAKRPPHGRVGDWFVERWYDDPRHVEDCDCDAGEVSFECARRSASQPIMRRLLGIEFGPFVDLPLGAIVATANLVDCIPMIGPNDEPAGRHVAPVHFPDEDRWYLSDRGLVSVEDVTDQVPYGHFAEGRWAWLLEDIEPLAEPVPFRGGQGWSRSWSPS